MPEMSLQDAVRLVLREASEPLHYREIADIIAAERYREAMGATPDKTVAAALSAMRRNGENYSMPGRPGYYVHAPLAVGQAASASPDDRGEDDDPTDDSQVRIQAYGLYWERDKVEWDAGRGQIELLGRQNRAAQPVDFADQQGVYLLHQMQTVTYVGRTAATQNGLFGRLRDHVKNPRRSGRWDRFSWFGLRPVNEDATLGNAPQVLTTDLLITILEAVLIETYLPSFNDKSGDLMGELYEQVIDPDIAKERAAELLRDAMGR